MAHEKVYGICENKCRVEVIPKENITCIRNIHVGLNGFVGQDYPDGYSDGNTVVVGMMTTLAASGGGNTPSYGRGINYGDIEVSLTDVIRIQNNSDMYDYYVTLVLMKVTDGE